MSVPYACPGCSGTSRAAATTFPESVFTLNYIHRTREDAIADPKAPVRLEQCASCGLIHAPADEPMRSCYDAGYENTQEHSPVFQEHLRNVCALLAQRTGQQRPCRVLEVGCGKGGFLNLLCQRDGWSGDGYDTSYAGPPVVGNARFHQQYVSPEALAGARYDLVVCRHVVEHIDRIGDFLTMLAESARCTGASQVMIETPDFGWIAASGAFWDIFHEHRNYFGREALAGLCRQAGFRVDAHCATFQGQYQNLLLTPQPGPPPTPQPESISPTCRLAAFARATAEKIRTVSATVEDARAGGRWAIWGAGAKGVSLANHLQHAAGMVPAIVFDINPAKQGSFLPGHGTPICAPEGELLRSVSLVVVANPAYGVEIKRTIAEAGAKSTRLFLLR